MDPPTPSKPLTHTRHDSHHNFSMPPRDFQPRSPSPLKHHQIPTPSPSATNQYHNPSISPSKLSFPTPIYGPRLYHQKYTNTLFLAHRTTIFRWERTERKFTQPCLKCTDDGHEDEAPDHSMIECSAVLEWYRVRLRKDREELHDEILEMLRANYEAPVFAALEAMVRILPGVAQATWVPDGRVEEGVREEAVGVLTSRWNGKNVDEEDCAMGEE